MILNELFQALIIFGGSILVAKLLHFLLLSYARKITERTKSELDDKILEISIKPIFVFVIIVGIYFALISVSFLRDFHPWFKKLFFATVVLLFASVISKIFTLLVSRLLRLQGKFKKTPKLIARIISITIYLVAILIILDYLNIKVTPLMASLGLGGVAVALAFQGTLANLFAGLHIISDRPINVGDYVELEGGICGYVEDIGWRSTRLRTRFNNFIIVPNSKLAESTIKNLTAPHLETTVKVECGVSYDSDLEKVQKITEEVAQEIQKNVEGAVKNFKPFVRYHTFGDSNINFSVYLRVAQPTDQYKVVHEFIKALKKRYDKENIEISWPVRKIYYGNSSKNSSKKDAEDKVVF